MTASTVKATCRCNRVDLLGGLLGFALIVVGYLSSPQLSYFWDEWTILESKKSPLLGLFVGHFGLFIPLGRALFLLQVWIFGEHYMMIVLTNAIFAFTMMFFVFILLRQQLVERSRALQFVAGSIAIFQITHAGTWYAIQTGIDVFRIGSSGLALAAGISLANQKRKFLWIILSALSFLFCGATAIVLSFLILAVPIILNRLPRRSSLVILPVGAAVSVVSSELAFRFTPFDPNAVGDGLNYSIFIKNFYAILETASLATWSWILSSITPWLQVGVVDQLMIVSKIAQVAPIITLFSVLVLVSLPIHVFLRFTQNGTTSNLAILALHLLHIGLWFSNLVVAVERSDFGAQFHIRYGPTNLPFVVLIIGIIVAQLIKQNQQKLVVALVVCAVTIPNVLGILNLSDTSKRASYESRVHDTSLQLNELRECQEPQNVVILKTIQPSMSPDRICDIALEIRGLTD